MTPVAYFTASSVPVFPAWTEALPSSISKAQPDPCSQRPHDPHMSPSFALYGNAGCTSVSSKDLGTSTVRMPAARHPPKQVPRFGTKPPRSQVAGKTTCDPVLCGMTRDKGLWDGRCCTGTGVRGAPREWQASCPDSGVLGFIDTKDNPMRALWNRASIGWCRTFHPEPLWPVHGKYRCRACLRMYAVPWQEGDVLPTRPATSQAAAPVSANAAHYCS